MTRIPFERLDFCPDGERLLLDGVPFTGVAIHEASGGPFRGEEEYQDGVQHGVARVWWLPTGKLNHEQEWVRGQPHGTSRGWFPDGRLRSEEVYEGGVCVRRRTWD